MTTLLNLLPPARRTALQKILLGRTVRGAAVFVLSASCILALCAAAASVALNRALVAQRAATHEAKTDAVQASGGTLPEDRIRRLNAQLKRLAALQGEYVKTSTMLAAIATQVPPGVRLTSLEYDRAKKTLALRGVAATRDALLALQKNLTSTSAYSNVTAPVSNLLERTNITFEMNMQLNVTQL